MSVTEVNGLRSGRTQLRLLVKLCRAKGPLAGKIDTAKVARTAKPLLAELTRALEAEGYQSLLKQDDWAQEG